MNNSQKKTPRHGSKQSPKTLSQMPKKKGSRGSGDASRNIISNASAARKVVLNVARDVRERDAFVGQVLQAHLDSAQLTPADKAFATKLAFGIVSTQGTLDEAIDRFLKKPRSISPSVRDVLRIGTYEILFLDKSPHAAVDQGVELVKEVAIKAKGLVNAVLRKIAGAKPSFPFGDPSTDGAALARLEGFPFWITEMIVRERGPEYARTFMQASNLDAPVFIAVNSLKTSDEKVLSVINEIGFEASPVNEVPPQENTDTSSFGCYRLSHPRAVAHPRVRQLFAQGKILASDAASQMIAHLAMPDVCPQSFLEIGSGRGTKTILLQNAAKRKFGTQVALTILDSHAFKTDLAKKRAETYDIDLAGVLTHDATHLDEVLNKTTFDAVFLDAPCSGLGTLRRHPEIRWRLTEKDIAELARLDAALLESASKRVSPGGMLTYATCTITKSENENLVSAFLKSESGKDFSLLPVGGRTVFFTQLKPGSCDAHFAVRLVRTSAVV